MVFDKISPLFKHWIINCTCFFLYGDGLVWCELMDDLVDVRLGLLALGLPARRPHLLPAEVHRQESWQQKRLTHRLREDNKSITSMLIMFWLTKFPLTSLYNSKRYSFTKNCTKIICLPPLKELMTIHEF